MDKREDVLEEGLRSARLMISGRYRIPWTTSSDVVETMIEDGLLSDDSGYLTARGVAALRTLAQPIPGEQPSREKGE